MTRNTFCSVLLSAAVLCLASNASAAPWSVSGPDGGDARRITPDPHDHTHLYLGAVNGWIYESHNSGTTWVRLSQLGKRDDLVLDSIVIDPQKSKHLIVGAWVINQPDGGVFTSNDGGLTWASEAEMEGQSVRALAVAPSDPKIMIAGSLQGVFRSTDSGRHWNRISPADSKEIHEIESVAIDPKDPRVIYAGTWHLPWKTTDGGEHWQNIKQGIIDDSDVFSIIVDPKSAQVVYASACSGIYKSENAGAVFKKIQGIPSTARRTRVLFQDPQRQEVVFAGTTEGLFRSVDAGATWIRVTGPEVIVNDVSVDATDSHRVMLATDRGGVLASDDGGDSFHPSNGGFSARQITAMKRDVKQPNNIYVGVVNDKDWGGVFQSEDGGATWAHLSNGLHGLDVFSLGQAPDGTMVAGTAHGIFRLDAAAATWARVDEVQYAPAVVKTAPPAPARTRPPVPVGRNRFAQSAGGTKRLPPPSAAKAAPAATASEAAKAGFNGSVYALTTTGESMLAATSEGMLASVDNGVSWKLVPAQAGVDWRMLAAVKEHVVVAALHSVAVSADSGTTWTTVKLPEDLTQIAAISVDPLGEIWVGSREGLFTSTDSGSTWSKPSALFANAVSSLFYDEASSRMTVATAGQRGAIYTVQVPQRTVTYFESGWNLRFARPLGDHLVAATLFDGIIIQPRMVPSSAVGEMKARETAAGGAAQR